MNYFLIQLSFDTAVHFGTSDSALSLSTAENHILADTLFSALCHTALQAEGEETLQKLIQWAKDGSFLLSDTMLWKEETYYLPKPCKIAERSTEIPTQQAKALKNLQWIPVQEFPFYADSLGGNCDYDPKVHNNDFGHAFEVTKSHVQDGQDTTPYQVGLYQFAPNCGLYFLAGLETEEQEDLLLSLTNRLGMGGIGGKISSGYGKFHMEDSILLNEFFDDQTEWLYKALTGTGNANLLLTSSLPKREELESAVENASYQMVRRGGFIFSETYAPEPMKKQTQYFFRAGAVLQNQFSGDVYPVGSCGTHPVYRYGKPLFLGVNF